MFGKDYKAGVSFSSDHAQIAVLEFRKEEISLVHLEELENDRLGEHWYLRSLLGKTEKLYKKVSGVSVAFDNASVQFHSFPMDTSLTREEQQEQTQWEISKFVPGFTPKDYLLDVHTMRTRAKDHVAELFLVCARRSALQNVQSALVDSRIALEIADVNFFGGQYALLVNYPEVRGKNIAIVEIGTDRVDIGILNFGRLTAFRCKLYSAAPECVGTIEEFLAEQQRIAEIYLHGSGLSLQMQEEVARNAKIPLVRINPFRRVQVGKSVRGFGAISGNEHRFASAVGVVLRKR